MATARPRGPARPARGRSRPARAARPTGRALTPAEGLLWEMLRDERLGGLAFARRHPHRRFVLDFFCPDVGVAVQLDAAEDDANRRRKADLDASALEAEGLIVVRVAERRVLTDLPGVLAEIARAAAGRRGTWGGPRA